MSQRKLLLAHIRKGNYAHAGEEQAINLILNLITPNPNQTLLDIGCGLGGTANYIQEKGYGHVTGIDIDPTVLEQAKEYYPNIPFYYCDANLLNDFFSVPSFKDNQKFDVLYSFNAFFCFQNQENCLKQFALVAKPQAELLIFDYTSPGHFSGSSPFTDETKQSTAALRFNPINLSNVAENLKACSWKLEKIIPLDIQYRTWYQELIHKMESNKEDLIAHFGSTPFHELHQGYQKLLEMLKQGIVGGGIVYAKKMPK